jgi:hypothetical protein
VTPHKHARYAEGKETPGKMTLKREGQSYFTRLSIAVAIHNAIRQLRPLRAWSNAAAAWLNIASSGLSGLNRTLSDIVVSRPRCPADGALFSSADAEEVAHTMVVQSAVTLTVPTALALNGQYSITISVYSNLR